MHETDDVTSVLALHVNMQEQSAMLKTKVCDLPGASVISLGSRRTLDLTSMYFDTIATTRVC